MKESRDNDRTAAGAEGGVEAGAARGLAEGCMKGGRGGPETTRGKMTTELCYGAINTQLRWPRAVLAVSVVDELCSGSSGKSGIILFATATMGCYDSISNVCIRKRRIPRVNNNMMTLRRLPAVVLGYYGSVVVAMGRWSLIHSPPFNCAVKGQVTNNSNVSLV